MKRPTTAVRFYLTARFDVLRKTSTAASIPTMYNGSRIDTVRSDDRTAVLLVELKGEYVRERLFRACSIWSRTVGLRTQVRAGRAMPCGPLNTEGIGPPVRGSVMLRPRFPMRSSALAVGLGRVELFSSITCGKCLEYGS